MLVDNYLFRNQVLMILTKNLTIRILHENNHLIALCYFTLPLTYDKDDVFEVVENCDLTANVLEYPLFTFEFNLGNIPIRKDWYEFFDLLEEARLALLDAVKWKEYWFNL